MHLNLRYGPHNRHRLDLYTPRAGQPSRGLIFYLYGGSWRKGDRRTYRFLATTFNRRGYSLAIPDYRVFPESRYPDFMEDAALALSWLKQNGPHHDVELENLFLMGHSAGAHIGALLLTNPTFFKAQDFDPDLIKGFIGLAGPYGFNPLKYDVTADIFEPAQPIEQATPLENVTGKEPPMLLLHGANDKTVYPVNTLGLEEALNNAGASAKGIVYPAIGHVGILTSFIPMLRWRAPVLKDVLSFLEQPSLTSP